MEEKKKMTFLSFMRKVRTEELKQIRRKYGDNSGKISFSDMYYFPTFNRFSNTI